MGLILTFFVGIFILLGVVFATKFKNNKLFTDFSISLAFGVIVSLIIYEIIPETYHILTEELNVIKSILCIIILALIGIFLLKILDSFIPHHEHEAHHEHIHKTEDCHNEHLYHIGFISSIAVIIHNIIEGMSLYLVATTNTISGLLLCIGIGLHNIPMGLVIATTLYNSNYSKKDTLIISLIVSLSTFLGGIIMLLVGGVPHLVEGILLGITLGMLIYISMFELFHQMYHMKNKKVVFLGVVIGILLLTISMFAGHHVGHVH